MHFRTRFVYFKSCRYNLCIFAQDLSIFKSCRYNLCIIKTHSTYYYGNVAIIHAFFARDLFSLMVVDIIYAFSRYIYPYYYGDVAIIYAFFARYLSLFNGCRYNFCIIKTHSPLLLGRCS